MEKLAILPHTSLCLITRILEWVAISFSILKNYFIIIILLKPVVKYKNKSIKYCWWNFTIRTTWVSAKPLYVCLAVAQQAPLSMGFSRLEYWSGLPYPSPGNLPDPWITCTGRRTVYRWATWLVQIPKSNLWSDHWAVVAVSLAYCLCSKQFHTTLLSLSEHSSFR